MFLILKFQINLFSIICIFNLLNTGSCSFIERNQPIVIVDNGEGESHFSYSIAATNVFSNTGVSGSLPFTSKIYIGSPKSKYLRSVNQNVQRPGETGSVWECKLTLRQSSADRVECNNLDIPPSTAVNDVNIQGCCSVDNYNTRRSAEHCYTRQWDGMWLGGSISLGQRDEFIVCGSRWQTTTQQPDRPKSRVSGICYNVTTGENSPATIKTEFKPLLHSHDEYSREGVIMYAHAQFGFASVVDNQHGLLISMPGYSDWRGQVAFYNAGEMHTALCRPLTTYFDYKLGHTNYFGYSVTSGEFLEKGNNLFAVGAPRVSSKQKDIQLAGSVTLLEVYQGKLSFVPENKVFGDQMGAYFGSVMASANIYGSETDALIIGSPFHNDETSESFDIGSVYILMAHSSQRKLVYKETLRPNKDSGGRFGSAICNMGDINYDQFEDVAISAPGALYGVGQVYIYFGGPSLLSQQTPLIISAGEVNTRLRGFGSTLFGNVDMDGNGTPDLLIGSFISKQVIIYRTRPKMEISLFVSYFANNQQIGNFKREDKEFQVQYCLITRRQPYNFSQKLKIWVDVSVDERFQFVENSKRQIVFSKEVSPDCNNAREYLNVKLTKDLDPNDNTSILFNWNFEYNETVNLPKNIQTYKVSGASTSKPNAKQSGEENTFCSYCPAPFKSASPTLEQLPLAADNCDKDANGNTVCKTKLRMHAEITNNNFLSVQDFIIGSEESRYIKVIITNHGQTAYSPTIKLIVKGNSKITNSIGIHLEGNQKCSPPKNKLEKYIYECSDSLHSNNTLELKFKISVNIKYALQIDEQIQFDITAYPNLYKKNSITFTTSLELKSQYQLVLNDVKQEVSDITLDNSKLVVFKSLYQVSNLGISPLSEKSIHLRFRIPINNTQVGKIISVGVPVPTKEIQCMRIDNEDFEVFDTKATDIISPSNSQSNFSVPTTISRRKREDNRNLPDSKEPTKQAQIQIKSGKSLNIECSGGNATWICLDIQCVVLIPLRKNNPLNIDLRLALITETTQKLIADDTREITIKTDGQAFKKVENAENAHSKSGQWSSSKNEFIEKASSVTQLRLIRKEDYPAWFYFVSVVGGLTLFLLLAFCLSKCGFFRRKTREELESAKAKAKQEDELAENFPLPPPPQ